MEPKAIHESRTNRTIAGMVALIVVRVIVQKVPALAPIADVLSDEVVSALEAGLGALGVYFRQQATKPKDNQDVVTPRP